MNMQPRSVVTVFVRHRSSCSYASRGEFYRGCQCSKFLRYSRNGKQHRKATGTRTWSIAEDKAVELQESLDRGDTPRPIVVKAPQATIADAIVTLISAKESEGISARRVKKLRFQLNDFEEFMQSRNKLYPSLLTSQDVIDYRATWDKKWKATTRQKAQQNLRGFLRTCCRENLNDLLAALRTIRLSKDDKTRLEPKPFTEKEIKTLLAQIPQTFPAGEVTKASLLVRTMIATGLAIRDAVQLERNSIQDGWLRINRQKTGRPVRQHLDSALCRELLDGKSRYVFWNSDEMTIGGAVTKWQDDIRQLMQDAKLWIKGNTTHRFRDTAVDFWLGEGCSLTDVAAMLGDTLAVCERHYASLASHRMEERLKKMPRRSWEAQQ
jgi:integrase